MQNIAQNINLIPEQYCQIATEYQVDYSNEFSSQWNIKISKLSYLLRKNTEIISFFNIFLSKYNKNDSILELPKTNIYNSNTICGQLTKQIIVSKYKNTPEYEKYKEVFDYQSEKYLLFYGMLLYFNIYDIESFKNAISDILKYDGLNYYEDLCRLFLCFFLLKKDDNILKENLYRTKNMSDDHFGVYLYINGYIDNNKHSIQNASELFNISKDTILKLCKEALSIYSFEPNHKKDKGVYSSGKLDICDIQSLKVIILTDIILITNRTNKYNEAINNILIESNFSELLQQEYPLAFFRSLLCNNIKIDSMTKLSTEVLDNFKSDYSYFINNYNKRSFVETHLFNS